MVIDTSTVCAILLGEEGAEQFARAVSDDPRRLMSAFAALEAAIVMQVRQGDSGGREFDLFIHNASADIVPLNSDQYELAREAWRKYGKGRHPAGLNIGDCCSCALSKMSGEPMLFKGGDFAGTDGKGVYQVMNARKFPRFIIVYSASS